MSPYQCKKLLNKWGGGGTSLPYKRIPINKYGDPPLGGGASFPSPGGWPALSDSLPRNGGWEG